MIYLISGNEELFIKNEINKLCLCCDNIFEFNGLDKDFSIEELVDSCLNETLFSDKKIIKVYNPPFLIKKYDEALLKDLLNYINNPSLNTDLIFYTYDDSFNKNLKIYKEIAKNAEIKNCASLNSYNFKNECYRYFEQSKLNITNDAKDYLTRYSDNSFSSFINNLEILKNYPEKIDLECVKKLCSFSLNNNIFDLLNALSFNNVSKAITIFRNICLDNNSVFLVVSSLSNQLRFIYQVNYLKNKNYSNKEIADNLKAKEIRVELTVKNSGNLSSKKCIEMLDKLSLLDVLNKSDSSISLIDRFELFILRNFHK